MLLAHTLYLVGLPDLAKNTTQPSSDMPWVVGAVIVIVLVVLALYLRSRSKRPR